MTSGTITSIRKGRSTHYNGWKNEGKSIKKRIRDVNFKIFRREIRLVEMDILTVKDAIVEREDGCKSEVSIRLNY